ncbi:MAG TPA: CHAT domain-containing tetratricopeptide repeat protein [Bryobacteraceae bacterium]
MCSTSARLLEAEILLSDDQLDAANAILSQGLPQFPGLEARRTWLGGDLQFARRNYTLAEDLYRKAGQLASSADAADVLNEIDISRAQLVFVSHHDSENAAALFREVEERSAAAHQPYHEAVALNGIGMIRLRQWRFDEAIPWFQKAMEAAKRGGGNRLIVVANNNLTICYYRLGSFDEAVNSYHRAMSLVGENGPATLRMHLNEQMGNTLLLQSNVHGAIAYYQKAISLAKTDEDQARYYRTLAHAYITLGDWDSAERSISKAISFVNDDASKPWVEMNHAAIAAGRGKSGDACDLYQQAIRDGQGIPEVLWESHAALASLYNQMKDYRQADEEYTATIRTIDDNLERISTKDYSLTFFSFQMGFYHDYVRALLKRQLFQQALDVADSSRARLLRQRLALSQTPERPEGHDFPAIARRLNSVLLFYLLTPEQSYLWVIKADGIHPPILLPPAQQIRDLVTQYQVFIEQRLGDPIAHPNESGRRLYEMLLAPAVHLIPPDSRVILLPDDALNWLNFETLPVYGGSPSQPSHYWIQDVHAEIAPSLRVLITDKPTRPHRPDSLLIIGDPVSPSPEFPQLAYASKEISGIESSLPNARKSEFTGAAARAGVYRAASPNRFALVHFSTHAVANKFSPLDSAIILSPQGDRYRLYARDVIEIPLNADLVTISACRSAGAKSYFGEGLVGFAWAFLQAGAHNVIAGLWDVTDSSTPDMMKILYTQLAAGVNPPEALRTAKLSLIRSAHGYHRPYYWGPFQIYTR